MWYREKIWPKRFPAVQPRYRAFGTRNHRFWTLLTLSFPRQKIFSKISKNRPRSEIFVFRGPFFFSGRQFFLFGPRKWRKKKLPAGEKKEKNFLSQKKNGFFFFTVVKNETADRRKKVFREMECYLCFAFQIRDVPVDQPARLPEHIHTIRSKYLDSDIDDGCSSIRAYSHNQVKRFLFSDRRYERVPDTETNFLNHHVWQFTLSENG